jgi:hypothetical protein
MHALMKQQQKSAENKAYLMFNILYGKCWWYASLNSFHVNGIFFIQNINITFYFDEINVLL